MMKSNNIKIPLIIAFLSVFVVASFSAFYTMDKPVPEDLAVGGGPGTINQISPFIVTGGYVKVASSTAGLQVPSLANCDTIDTDGDGKFECGVDGGGAGGSATTTINGVTGPDFTFATGTATGIGLTISSSTGTLTFTPTVSSGYNIPLTASTTEWANKISSQWITSGSNIYYNTGNVGIGTTAPGAKLHVVAETRYNFGNEYAIVAADTSNPNQRVSLGYDDALSAGVLQAATEGSSWDTLLLNPNGGNVGIGTTNPTTKLFIKSATGVNSILGIDTTDSGNSTSNATIRLYEASTNKWDIYNDGDAGDLFKIEPTGGTNSLTINSTGNVGIGTTAPDYKLDVRGSGNDSISASIQVRSLAALGNTSAAALVNVKSINSSGFYGAFPSDYATATFQDRVAFSTNSDASGLTLAALSAGQDIRFFAGGSTESVRINSSGNVGIGTTTPGAKLQVLSTTEQLRLSYNTSSYWTDTIASDGGRTVAGLGSDADLNFSFSGATDGDFSINSDDLFVDTSAGNVGIGTASPTSQLEVLTEGVASSRGLTVSQHNSGAQGALINFYKSRGTEASPTVVSNGDYVGVFFARPYDGNEFMFTSSFGFRVNGTVTNDSVPTDFLIATGATNDTSLSNERLRITSSGNVGIGSSTPSSLLTVQGNAWIGGNITATGTLAVTGSTTISSLATASCDVFATSVGSLYCGTNGAGAGLTSLNSQTGNTQTFATGTATGIGLNIVSGSDIHTFTPTVSSGYNIPLTASTTEWHNKVSSQWTTTGSNIYYNTGNVGIGTTTPATKLDIVGTSGSNNIFTISSSTNSRLLTLNALGYLGIGSSTPSAHLVVDDGVNATSTVQIGGPGSVGCLAIRDTDDAGYTYVTALNGVLSASMTSCE